MSTSHRSGHRPAWFRYRFPLACAVALVAAFLLIWINGAVGILGSEDNPLNLVYAGVLGVAAIGALLAGFEPRGMARAMQFTAAAQVAVGALVLAFGYFTPLVTALFTALWLLAALLFRSSADGGPLLPPFSSVGGQAIWRRVRWLAWGAAAILLTLPAIAMRFTDEVNWSPFDFVVMGLMLGTLCLALELTLRAARSHAFVLAGGIALLVSFAAVWITLAVGIVGKESDPINAVFLAVPAIALLAAVGCGLQPRGLARAMQVAAGAQGVTVLVTAAMGEGATFLLPAAFVLMWLAAFRLFLMAAKAEEPVAACSTSGPAPSGG